MHLSCGRGFTLKAIVIYWCFLVITNSHTCATPINNKKEPHESINWLKRIADKGQEANLRAKNDKYDFKKIFSEDHFDMDTLRKTSFELLDTGIPSKIGYGFLMGYTSGFCLKKVSYIVIIESLFAMLMTLI